MSSAERSASGHGARTSRDSGLKRYLLVTLGLFLLGMAGIALAVWLTGGSGSLPFEYEGFD